MPRKGPVVIEEIPLFLIPPVLREEVMEAGDGLERIIVKRCFRHFYNVSIHTRPVRRERRWWGP
jgi:hypothetical protein